MVWRNTLAPDPPKYVTHLGPPIFSRPSTKNPDKNPLYKFSLNCSWGVFKGSLVWKVLTGVVLSIPFLSEYICYNRKLNNILKFRFHMYDKKFISVTSQALDPPPSVTNCHTISDPLPLEHDILYRQPLTC